jgi:hypothetical protein
MSGLHFGYFFALRLSARMRLSVRVVGFVICQKVKVIDEV